MIFFKNILVVIAIVLGLINNLCAVKLGSHQFEKVDGQWVYASGKHIGECVTSDRYLEKLNQMSDLDLDEHSWSESKSRSKSQSCSSSSQDSSSATFVEYSSSSGSSTDESEGPELYSEGDRLANESEEESLEQSCYIIDKDTNSLCRLNHSSKKLTKHNQLLAQNPDFIQQINTLLQIRREQLPLNVLSSGTPDDLKDATALLQGLEKSLSKFNEKPLYSVTQTEKGSYLYEFGNDDNELDVNYTEQALVPYQKSVSHENSVDPEPNDEEGYSSSDLFTNVEIKKQGFVFVDQVPSNEEESSAEAIDLNEENHSSSDLSTNIEINKQDYTFLDVDTEKSFFFNGDSKKLTECDQILTKNPDLIKQINAFLDAKRNKPACQADLSSDHLVLFQDLVKFLSTFYDKPLHSIIQDKNGFCIYKFGNDDGSENELVNDLELVEKILNEENKIENLNQQDSTNQENVVKEPGIILQDQTPQNNNEELDKKENDGDKNTQEDNNDNQISRKQSSIDLQEKREQNNRRDSVDDTQTLTKNDIIQQNPENVSQNLTVNDSEKKAESDEENQSWCCQCTII